MSGRLDKRWVVFRSIENREHDRCVDLFRRPNGTFGFEEFRRDVEDQGRWTPVAFFSSASFASETSATLAAEEAITWFRERR